MFKAGNILATLVFSSGLLSHPSAQAEWNPQPNWKDSYSVGDQCYCDSSNFDHNLGSKTAPTPIGDLNVTRICADLEAVLGEGPEEGRLMYNDIQCGHGPANDAADEVGCPGRVDLGADGCQVIGPTWNLERVYGPWPTGDGSDGVQGSVEHDGGTNDPLIGDDSGTGAELVPLDRAAWALSASHERGRHSDVYKAIDGDAGSRWSTGTRQAPGQYFTVDLGQTLSFDRIALATERSPNDYPREYRVEVSVDGVLNRVIASGRGDESLLVIDFDTVEAQYITIFQEGATRRYWWSIHEIDVFRRGSVEPEMGAVAIEEPAPPPEEVVPEAEIAEVNRLPDLLFERYNWQIESSMNRSLYNVLDEYWASRWTTRQSQRPGQFFQVDMGESLLIDAVVLGTVKLEDKARGYEVYLSEDGENWGEPVAMGVQGEATLDNAWDIVRFKPHTARFVRIEQTGSDRYYWWSINELHIGRYEP